MDAKHAEPAFGLMAIQPEGWATPRGYVNGLVVPAGRRLLVIAGQIGWDAQARLVTPTRDDEDAFVCQFAQALSNVATVVTTAGGSVSDVISLRIYVTDKARYLAHIKAVGAAYRAVFGRHYPTMALVQVADLLEPGALVEIEGMAALAEALGLEPRVVDRPADALGLARAGR